MTRMTHLSICLLFACVLGFAASAQAFPKLPPKERAIVLRGDVVSYAIKPPGGGNLKMGKAIGIVEGSPEAVVHTLMDIGRYRFFLPTVKGSRQTKRKDPSVWGVVETTLPWPARDAWAYLKITYKHRGGGVFEMHWKMRNGTLKQYKGYALIEPYDDKCTLTYQILVEPKTSAPDSVLSKGARRVAEMVLHRVRLRLKALRRFKKIPKGLRARYRS
jgi:ribosome-associated toxin RatA of RatAB toxin-antitoxin module